MDSEEKRIALLLERTGLAWFSDLPPENWLEVLNYEYARSDADIREDVQLLNKSTQSRPMLSPSFRYSRYLSEIYSESFPDKPWYKTQEHERQRACLRRHVSGMEDDDSIARAFSVYPASCFDPHPPQLGGEYFFRFRFYGPRKEEPARQFKEWYLAASALGSDMIPEPLPIDVEEFTTPDFRPFSPLPFRLGRPWEEVEVEFYRWHRQMMKELFSPRPSHLTNPRGGRRGRGGKKSTILKAISDLGALRNRTTEDFEYWQRHERRKIKHALLLWLRFRELWTSCGGPVNPFSITRGIGLTVSRPPLLTGTERTAGGRTQPVVRKRQLKVYSSALTDLLEKVVWTRQNL